MRKIIFSMAILNSNPEILLKKRKDKDTKRLLKQQEANARDLKRKKVSKKKFLRMETIISNVKSKGLEKKRVNNVHKYINTHQPPSETNEEGHLLFIVRTPNHTKGLKIPAKSQKILNLLHLTHTNTGVFFNLTNNTKPLLNFISPYITFGTPSVASIRKLFQKRASIKINDQIIKLDNNQLVEDKFADLGMICIEDLIHCIVNKEHLKEINSWVLPFKLNLPVNGFGPQNKLAKLKYALANKKVVSLSGDIHLNEIDIDKVIDEQN